MKQIIIRTAQGILCGLLMGAAPLLSALGIVKG